MHPKDAVTASTDAVLREILDVVTALREGHFTSRMQQGMPGLAGQIAQALNRHLDMLQTFRQEHHRIMEEVGVTGRLGGQAEVGLASGAWKEMVDETNRMSGNVTAQFRDGGNVVRALLAGDLSARMTARCIHGEFREFREHFNDLAEVFEQRADSSLTPEPAH